MIKTKQLIITPVWALLLSSCGGQTNVNSYLRTPQSGITDPVQCENQTANYEKFQECKSNSENVFNWAEPIISNENSNKIVLWLADGPSRTTPFTLFNSKEINTVYTNFLSVLYYYDVNFYLMNQSQWRKVTKYNQINKMTKEDIDKENNETVKNINNVVKKLKEQKKEVILAGQGYGSYLLNLYLAKYGAGSLTSAVALSSRLRPNEKIKKPFQNNCKFYYYGTNDEVVKENEVPDGKGVESFCKFLKLGNGFYDNQTKALENQNISKVTYVSAIGDKYSGWLNGLEKEWISKKNAKLKFFQKKEVESSIKDYSLEWGNEFISDLGNDESTFAHFMGIHKKALIRELFVSPFPQN